MANSPFRPQLRSEAISEAVRLCELPSIIDPALRCAAKARLAKAGLQPSSSDRDGRVQFERLEKRGDSVLKYLVNRMLYESGTTSAEHAPHYITVCETFLISNAFLARLTAAYKLEAPTDASKDTHPSVSEHDAVAREKAKADMFEAHLGAVDVEGRLVDLLRWATLVLGHLYGSIRPQALAHMNITAVCLAEDSASRKNQHLTLRDLHTIMHEEPKRLLNEVAQRHRYTVSYQNRKHCLLVRDGEETVAGSIAIEFETRGRHAELLLARQALRMALSWWPEEEQILLEPHAKRRKIQRQLERSVA